MKAIKSLAPQEDSALVLFSSVDKENASPGDILTYTVRPLTNIVIRDEMPANTTFVRAGYGTLPKNIWRIAITSPTMGTAVRLSGP
jgi:uncharacterized repeat protein (TIGR01451 family)